MAFVISGSVTNNSVALGGKSLKLRRTDTNGLLDQATTAGNGTYSVGTSFVGTVKLILDEGGNHEAVFTAESSGSGSTTKNFIPPPNNNPVLGTVSNVSYTTNTGVKTADVSVTDSDFDDTFVNNFTKVSGPSWFTLSVTDDSAPNGVYRRSFNTAGVSPGVYSASFRGEDDWAGRSTTKNFTITIIAANNPPTLTNPGTQNFLNNSGVHQLQLIGSDPDDDPLTFSKQTAPTWVTIPSSGLASFNADSAIRGAFSVRARVSDGSLHDDQTFTVNILNNPPLVTDPGTIMFTSGQGNQTYQILYTDSDGDTVVFSKTGGDTLASINASGLIAVDTNNLDATYSVDIAWDDDNGGTGSLTIEIELGTPDPAPEAWVVT